jgi:hypothetical protein
MTKARSAMRASTTNKNLNFLKTFPTKVFSLGHLPPPLPRGYHLPRPSFSDSLQSFLSVPKLLKRGNVDDIFLFDLEKKPSFLVEKLGYPLDWPLLVFAAAHEMLFEAYPFMSYGIRLGDSRPE